MSVALRKGHFVFGWDPDAALRQPRRRRPFLRHWRRRMRLARVDGIASFYSPRFRFRLLVGLLLLAMFLVLLSALAGDEHRPTPDTGRTHPATVAPRPTARPSAPPSASNGPSSAPVPTPTRSAGHPDTTSSTGPSSGESVPPGQGPIVASSPSPVTPTRPRRRGAAANAGFDLSFSAGEHRCHWVIRGRSRIAVDLGPGERLQRTIAADAGGRVDVETDGDDCQVTAPKGTSAGSPVELCELPPVRRLGELLLACG